MKPVLLDLFCGAGGATKGYQRAGFFVVGVDIGPQRNYCGDAFVQMDALEFLQRLLAGETIAGFRLEDFVAIHASPPCQAYSVTRHSTKRDDHPELIPPTRELLKAAGLPYVIENVPGAPLIDPVVFCGSGFGLPLILTRDGIYRRLYRHRLFECNFPLMVPPCSHTVPALGVYGHGPWDRDGDLRRGGYQGTAKERGEAMGIDWMNRDELSQAIPPAYTEHIGHYLLEQGCGVRLVPITFKEACAFVERHHRHHRPPRGCLFCLAVEDGEIRGVAIVGRPVARGLQDGYTAEVTRVCTDGARNACSMLYAAAWRACRALGYRRLVTYTLPEEGGASLRGAGWRCIGTAGGGSWDTPSRPRVDLHPTQEKLRWEVAA